MGAVTGAAGGVLRDLLINDTPLLFSPQEPIYSVAAVTGIGTYLFLKFAGLPEIAAFIIGVLVIAALRFAAIFLNIRLPAFKLPD